VSQVDDCCESIGAINTDGQLPTVVAQNAHVVLAITARHIDGARAGHNTY